MTIKTKDEAISEKQYHTRRKLISIVSIVLFIAALAILTVTVGKNALQFVSEPETLRSWVNSHGFLGNLALIGTMCLQVVIAFIPGEFVEIGAGYAYGAVEGMFLCLIGAAVGSTIIYLFTKLFGIKMVEAFISREKLNSLRFLKDARKLNLLIFILFFIPGTPKDIITYFIGLTKMKLSTFLTISTFARIPSVITSTIGGNALGLSNYTFAVVVFAVTALVSSIGILIYQKILQSQKN